MKEPLEKAIQLAICDYLSLKKYFFWRQNNVPMFDWKDKTYRAMPKYSLKGVSDIILIRKGGKVCFLEVKRKKGILSEHQIEFKRRCEEVGAEYYMVTSLDDVIAIGL